MLACGTATVLQPSHESAAVIPVSTALLSSLDLQANCVCCTPGLSMRCSLPYCLTPTSPHAAIRRKRYASWETALTRTASGKRPDRTSTLFVLCITLLRIQHLVLLPSHSGSTTYNVRSGERDRRRHRANQRGEQTHTGNTRRRATLPSPNVTRRNMGPMSATSRRQSDSGSPSVCAFTRRRALWDSRNSTSPAR